MAERMRRLATGAFAVAFMSICILAGTLAMASSAAAQPWWRLDITSAPTNLPATGEAQFMVTASNIGDGPVEAAPPNAPVAFSDEVPEGAEVQAIEAYATGEQPVADLDCETHGRIVSCKYAKDLPPFARLFLRITVNMNEPQPAPNGLHNVASLSGAQTPAFSKLAKVSSARTPFGIETYTLQPEEEGGAPDTQAGSHPFQLTATLDFNQQLAFTAPGGNGGIFPAAAALPRNLHFLLPPGLVGDANVVPQCSETDFAAVAEEKRNLCPDDTAIGVASVVINEPTTLGLKAYSVPLFNLRPAPGEPARFGFEVESVPVVLTTAVPSGGEYGVQVTVRNASQAAQVLASEVTFWGVPADSRHDQSRGWDCLDNRFWDLKGVAPCDGTGEAPTAFLELPTSCESAPITSVTGESWPAGSALAAQQLASENTTYRFPAPLTGCSALEFNPSLMVETEQSVASTPTGLGVHVHMPQVGLLSPTGKAESALRQTTVVLPQELQLSPAAANGLAACSALEFGSLSEAEPNGHLLQGTEEVLQTRNKSFTPSAPSCPDAAKVGTASIMTPLLSHEVQGSVYLAAQNADPFQSPLALYLLAEDPSDGVRVKLAGAVEVNSSTGQLTSTFQNTPQLPFSDVRFHFFGGERASVSTPAHCGSYPTTASFVPWSAEPTMIFSSSLQVASGPGGSACPSDSLPFSSSFTAGPTIPQGGAFSPLVVKIGKSDGDQPLSGISVKLPAGFAAVLSSVTPCQEPPPDQEWTCGEQSLVGHVREYSGLGGEPVVLNGEAYLTTGYRGAPFGLLVSTHAAAGPFDLGIVNVRSRIDVDPKTAAVSVASEPSPRGEVIPTMLKGVPVQLKALEVAVDRPSFEFNPTNCGQSAFSAILSGSEGAQQQLSASFKASNCASLPFHPTLSAVTQGNSSKANGASLSVRVTSSGLGVANIQKVALQLPKALPSRLTTIQKACPDQTFEANPASCDEGSVIGEATIHTPILKSPLTGPAYLVSHAAAAFPDVEFVLQGEGIKLILDGKTDIKAGITYSRFESTPDAPFTTFETLLPMGPHSALTANVAAGKRFSLCGAKLVMPTTITAQNGAVIQQETKIPVQGCGAVKGSKVTRAQEFAKALRACRKQFKHNKHKRAACEKKARKRYGPVKKAKKKKEH
jgi:hypothetical protein